MRGGDGLRPAWRWAPPPSRPLPTGAGKREGGRGFGRRGGRRETSSSARRERDGAGRPAIYFPIMTHKQIYYSDKYDDEEFEYR